MSNMIPLSSISNSTKRPTADIRKVCDLLSITVGQTEKNTRMVPAVTEEDMGRIKAISDAARKESKSFVVQAKESLTGVSSPAANAPSFNGSNAVAGAASSAITTVQQQLAVQNRNIATKLAVTSQLQIAQNYAALMGGEIFNDPDLGQLVTNAWNTVGVEMDEAATRLMIEAANGGGDFLAFGSLGETPALLTSVEE